MVISDPSPESCESESSCLEPVDTSAAAAGVQRLQRELKHLLLRIAEDMRADAVTVLLYDCETDEFDLPVQHGLEDPETFMDPGLVPGTDRLAGRIVHERSPIFADDVRGHSELDGPFARRERIASAAALPLLSDDGNSLGVLFVSYRSPGRFAPDRRAKLDRWVREVSAAIAQSNPFPLLRDRRRGSETEVDETLRNIVKLACNLSGRAVAVWLPRPGSSDEWVIHAATGLVSGYVKNASARRGDGSVIDEVLRTGRAVHLPDLSANGRFPFAQEAEKAGWRSMLGLPVRAREQSIGVLQVFSFHPGEIPPTQAESLRHLAEMASLAIENARRSRESEELALLASTLSAQPDTDSVMRVIAESTRRLVGGDSSAIVLLDKSTDSLVVGCRSSEHEAREVIPRHEHGLTRSILKEGCSVVVHDTETDDRVNPALRELGVRSLVGVRLELAGERFGVLYVYSRWPGHFSAREKALLKTVADQASVALGWNRLLLEPWTVIEQSTENLFRRDLRLDAFCRELDETLGFDFSAVQFVRPDRQTIENFYATGTAKDWEGRSRHYLHEDTELRDVQADIALARPLRTEILRGWDPRFDRGIFSTFHHERVVRIFSPLVVVWDKDGKPVLDWVETCDWKVTRERRKDGQRTAITIKPPSSNYEVIGTVEAGVTAGRRLGVKEARTLIAIAARHALEIRSAMLRHVLETVIEQVLQVARADSASLHYPYDPEQGRYLHEVTTGKVDRRFLKKFPPRPGGLGQRAIAEREAKLIPDPAQGHHDSELERQHPKLAAWGIRAMAAFPLLAGERSGVLYLHFEKDHLFRKDEVRWVQLLANRAADAIRQVTAYTEIRDRARQLTTLQSVVQDLVRDLGDVELLMKIARSAANTLAADVVTIYEYDEGARRFRTPPAISGRLRQEKAMHTQIHENDAPVLLVKQGKDLFVREVEKEPILNRGGIEREPGDREHFAVRESIRSCAGILLRVASEVVGVMFINYRRPDRFSDEDRETIKALASAAAIAIRNRRLLEKRQRDLMTITHDLRAPLNAITSSLKLLRRRGREIPQLEASPGPDLKSPREILELAEGLAEDMLDMSNGILDSLSREMGKKVVQTAEKIDASRELRRMCERMQMTNDRGPDLRFDYQGMEDGFPELYLDRQTFATVMYSLIHNAMKYSFPDTTVRLVCRRAAGEPRACLEVRSIGERIEERDKERIFEPFQRGEAVESTGRHHSGVGLGLWSARELIRATGGDLRVELSSTEPQEAAFIVEVPLGSSADRDSNGPCAGPAEHAFP